METSRRRSYANTIPKQLSVIMRYAHVKRDKQKLLARSMPCKIIMDLKWNVSIRNVEQQKADVKLRLKLSNSERQQRKSHFLRWHNFSARAKHKLSVFKCTAIYIENVNESFISRGREKVPDVVRKSNFNHFNLWPDGLLLLADI